MVMRRIPLVLSAYFFSIVLMTAGSGRSAADSGLPARTQAVLKTHCGRCHGPGSPAKGGMGYVLDRDRLVGRQQIVPGNPAESKLFRRVLHGEMPPPAVQARPGAEDLALLRRWIEAGAPAFDPPGGPR